MSLDMTTFDAALKQHYTPQRVENMVYEDNPFLALLAKYKNFGGKNLPVPILYGNPQGRSATFATAQSNVTESKLTDFVLTRVSDYAVATISSEVMEASKGNNNAFMEAATTEIDGALQSLTRSLAWSLFRDSSGYIGQVNAEPAETASTFTFTLKSIEDVVNFEVGQVLRIHSAKSGGSARTSDGSDDEWSVAAVDRDAGTITLTGTYNSSGTIAADDYIFVDGDRGSKISGLESWLPESAPSSTEFFGVDRSVDPTRLAGIRYDGSALPIEEALITAAARAAREGAKPSHCFLNHAKFAELEKALGSKVQYTDLKANAEIMFKGITIHGPRGDIKVIADHNCPSNVAYMLDMQTWKLYSLGECPRLIDNDGNKMLRQASADGVEVRAVYRAQLGCVAPGRNVRIKLA